MPKYVAFLRAINVGGHTVKMDYLRELFETLGFANCETFIASGNVVFDVSRLKPLAVERRIEKHLHDSLGYAVTTFVRSMTELAAVSAYKPFPPNEHTASDTLFVGFLSTSPAPAVKSKLDQLRNRHSDFHVNGREIYWLRRRLPDEPPFASAPLEKALGMQMTFRNMNTVRRLADKYCRD